MTQPLAHVPGSQRIVAIDAVRGFALLGIFLVNIQSFGEPFGEFIATAPPAGASALDVIAFYFVKIFCESKFYPLFAMLFGFGLMLQADRARQRSRSYWAPGARRYIFLTLLGLLHATLLWYGDILFIYGLGGLVLLCLHRVSSTTLAVLGGVFLGIGVVLMTGFSLFTAPPPPAPTSPPQTAAIVTPADPPQTSDSPSASNSSPTPEKSPVLRLLKAMGEDKAQNGPSDPVWMELEREAFKHGPTLDRILFNIFTWGMFLIVCLIGFGWDVLAMLILGALLFRLRLFDDSRAHWHRRLLLIGAFVGVPVCALAAAAGSFLPPGPAAAVFSFTAMLFGPLISLGYLSAITFLVRAGVLAPLTHALSCVGRLALTNYLLQTLIATFIFHHWGLGLFDDTTRAQRIAIVLGIYTGQILLSVLYLRFFTMGPMEFLWRTVTYLRLPRASPSAAL